MQQKEGYVYIMASGKNGTLYTGVTSDLRNRVLQHKYKKIKGFTEKYDCNLLVWYERQGTMEFAIMREKHIKKWERKWKLKLIEEKNPSWTDLFETL